MDNILGIGFWELVFIFFVALMVFGPRRLPEIAGKAGRFVRDLRNMSQGFLVEWQREITAAARLEELEQVRKELEETKQSLRQTQTELTADVAQIGSDLNTVITSPKSTPSTLLTEKAIEASKSTDSPSASRPGGDNYFTSHSDSSGDEGEAIPELAKAEKDENAPPATITPSEVVE